MSFSFVSGVEAVDQGVEVELQGYCVLRVLVLIVAGSLGPFLGSMGRR